MLLILAGVLAWVLLVANYRRTGEVLKSTSGKLMVALAVLYVTATVRSPYGEIAFWGFPNQYEGLFVHLSYFGLFMLAAVQANRGFDKALALTVGFSAAFVTLIGLLQYLGHYPLEWAVLRDLIWGDLAETSLRIGEGGDTIFSTLYHSNYVGSYVSLLLPIVLAFCLSPVTRKVRIGAAISALLLIALLVGSHSRAGLLGVSCAMAVLLVGRRNYLSLKKPALAIGFGALLILGFAFSRPGSQVLHLLTATQADLHAFTHSSDFRIKELTTEGGILRFDLGRFGLQLSPQAQGFAIQDLNGQPVPYRIESGVIEISDPRYSQCHFRLWSQEDLRLVGIDCWNKSVRLDAALTPAGFRIFDGYSLRDAVNAPKFPLPVSDRLFSSRGYFWSRTLPLLRDSFWIGHGPGVFALDFPQNDFAGKINVGHGIDKIIDKPHNLYLQIFHAAGALALAAFVALVGVIIVPSLSKSDPAVAGVAAGLLAYLIAGIFNDSHVSVAPVFWVLAGCLAGKQKSTATGL